jgi:hypothetical protein
MALICDCCLRCGQLLARSDKMVPGHWVVRCDKCDTFALEGDSKTFTATDGNDDKILELLQERIGVLDYNRHEAMLWGDLSDPRWSAL